MRTSLAALLCSIAASAHATSLGGVTGRSGKTAGVSCSGCHNPQATPATATTARLLQGGVAVTGPVNVTAGTRATFTLEVSGGPGAFAGTNIASDVGTLSPITSTLLQRAVGGAMELTHGDKLAFSGGKASWNFAWTAPATAGTAKVFIAVQSVNGDLNTSGDQQKYLVQDITIVPGNLTPTVATAPAANPASPTTLALSARGADDQGEAALLYTWSTTAAPTGAPAVTFSANGTNAAKATTATLSRVGAYTFNVKISDAAGAFVNATVSATVTAAFTRLTVTPAARSLTLSGQQQLSTGTLDQFSQAMAAPAGTVTWSVPTGQGTLTATGLYTAPAVAGGPYTVTASLLGKTATSAITVVTGTPPVVATAAARVVIDNKSFTLTALGSDDGGEALLKYTWAATAGTGVTFSPNGNNAAKRTTATLTRAGAYTFTVTIADAAGLAVTSAVSVTVGADFTSVSVTPATVTVKPGQTALLTANPLDQFNRAMTAPGTVSWVSFGGGTMNTTGEFHAGSTLGGPFEVRATLSGKSARAFVTVANDGVPVVLSPPTATPAAVTSRTTRLRAFADDEGGEPGLKYRWESTGPAPVAFAPNDSNAARQATATFAQAGTYTLTVTISNAAMKSATSTVSVDVTATADHLSLDPDRITLRPNGAQSFTVSLIDQFGDEVPMPGTIDWSATAGDIDADGVLHAVGAAGRYSVSASAGGLRAQALVTVDATLPTVGLVSPAPLAQLEGTVTLSATANDDDVLRVVRFLVDGVELGAVTSPPYEATWNTVTAGDGSHELKVVAEDAAGNRGETQSIQVQVWNDPTRPAPGPAMAEGMGCSASGLSLAPLLVLALLALTRKRVTVSPAGRISGARAQGLGPKSPKAGAVVPGTPGARGAPRRPHMTRPIIAVTLLMSAAASAQALTAEQRERCAIRLAANLLGTAPTPALLAATDPRNEVPNLLQAPPFIDRFAAFINTRFNPEPVPYRVQEPAYFLTRKLLTENKKWKELFVGPYVFTRQTGDTNGVMDPVITEDAVNGGYGYFQSPEWRTRFRGNELEGFRIVHAYRILNNALGIELKAALNTTGVSADGPQVGAVRRLPLPPGVRVGPGGPRAAQAAAVHRGLTAHRRAAGADRRRHHQQRERAAAGDRRVARLQVQRVPHRDEVRVRPHRVQV
ncbi:MAG: hypothetical protein IPJ65_24890 [Archangiaceae bacterium]|nr:hypothetical protein [Archangiaceae bacterium]